MRLVKIVLSIYKDEADKSYILTDQNYAHVIPESELFECRFNLLCCCFCKILAWLRMLPLDA